jgi:hypothetical protein
LWAPIRQHPKPPWTTPTVKYGCPQTRAKRFFTTQNKPPNQTKEQKPPQNTMKTNYYKIKGYWKDNHSDTFDEYLVTTTGDSSDETKDDELFFYFDSLKELKEATEMGEESLYDFVVTGYSAA